MKDSIECFVLHRYDFDSTYNELKELATAESKGLTPIEGKEFKITFKQVFFDMEEALRERDRLNKLNDHQLDKVRYNVDYSRISRPEFVEKFKKIEI